MGLGYIKLPLSFGTAFSNLSAEQVGRLVIAMLNLCETGEEPDFSPKQPEYYLWPQCRENVIESIRAYEHQCEVNRENGKAGGRPPKSNKNQSG